MGPDVGILHPQSKGEGWATGGLPPSAGNPGQPSHSLLCMVGLGEWSCDIQGPTMTPGTRGVPCSYLGRKQVNPEEEEAVEGLPHLVVAGYSYWTLAYVLSLTGARKLLASQPLHRMLPVDEFLPIMFDQHPK